MHRICDSEETSNSHPRILDEATAALDYESENIFLNNLKHIAVGRTIIMIAHVSYSIKNADIILIMDEGCMVEHGSHVDLLKQNGVYAQFVQASRMRG